ncbi:MAG TPA: BON domain-containing protein [Verrucomicrobiae bacterium]|jgi:osmotically-inducible protein OsmY|nr:BON domain-containing protein [Verrucomicrobiae bacterium]
MRSAKSLAVFKRAALPAILAVSLTALADTSPMTAVGDSASKPANPTTATAPKNDRELEREILIALTHDNINNGTVYRNVKIVASNGRVTFSGSVKNEKLHTKLIHIASGVVDATNIRDNVLVK